MIISIMGSDTLDYTQAQDWAWHSLCSDLCDEHVKVSLMWDRIGGAGLQKQLFHTVTWESYVSKNHSDSRNEWDQQTREITIF